MIGKLLKYDLRAMRKEFILIWPAMLIVSLVNRVVQPSYELSGNIGDILRIVLGMTYFALWVALVVIAAVFVIQRFYRGLLGAEGYLMHTLPAKTWQLIFTKLITAMILTIASGIVGTISVVIISGADWNIIQRFFGELGRVFAQAQAETNLWWLLLLEGILAGLLWMVNGFLLIYLSLAIGHLFNRNRIAMSIAAYLGLSMVLAFLGGSLISLLGEADLMQNLVDWVADRPWDGALSLGMLGLLLVELVQTVAFFWGTERILSRRLNLE